MKVYAPNDAYWVALDRATEPGEEIEVDDEVGEALLLQGWTEKPLPKRRGSKNESGTPGADAPDTAQTEEQ